MSSKHKSTKNYRGRRSNPATPWSEWLDYQDGETRYQGRKRMNDSGEVQWETRWPPELRYENGDEYDSKETSQQTQASASYPYTGRDDWEQRGDDTGSNASPNLRSRDWTAASDSYRTQTTALPGGLYNSLANLSIGAQSYSAPTNDSDSEQDSDSYSEYKTNFTIKDTQPDSDGGTTFGRICEEIGLYRESYGKSRGKDTTTTLASLWNPKRLQNNCVLVSAGYLLKMDSEALSKRLEVRLSPYISGVKVGEMESILGRLPNIHVVVVPFNERDVYRKKPKSQQRLAMRILNPWIRKYKRNHFALGYQRLQGSGHCVVAMPPRQKPVNGKDSLFNSRFMCYQNRTKGEDKAQEVRDSFFRFAIFVTPGSAEASMQMDFYKTVTPGVVSHFTVRETNWYATAAPSSAAAYPPTPTAAYPSSSIAAYQSSSTAAYPSSSTAAYQSSSTAAYPPTSTPAYPPSSTAAYQSAGAAASTSSAFSPEMTPSCYPDSELQYSSATISSPTNCRCRLGGRCSSYSESGYRSDGTTAYSSTRCGCGSGCHCCGISTATANSRIHAASPTSSPYSTSEYQKSRGTAYPHTGHYPRSVMAPQPDEVAGYGITHTFPEHPDMCDYPQERADIAQRRQKDKNSSPYDEPECVPRTFAEYSDMRDYPQERVNVEQQRHKTLSPSCYS